MNGAWEGFNGFFARKIIIHFPAFDYLQWKIFLIKKFFSEVIRYF